MEVVRSNHSFEIYTDGGCLPKGRGAWAYLILAGGEIVAEAKGHEEKVCSNRMEFTAAVNALSRLPDQAKAIVYTDSHILIDVATRDLMDWKARGWLRRSGRPVIFLDLMQRLDHELSRRKIEWKWVRAHSGDSFNERCDSLCRQELGIARLDAVPCRRF